MRPSVAILLIGSSIFFSSSGGYFASIAQTGPADPGPQQAAPAATPPASPVVPAPAQSAPPAQAAQTAPAGPAAQAAPVVDESALRFFARQGDTKRLEAEIARLKALYPGWEPPADPLAVPAVADEKLDAMWRLYGEGKLAELRSAIADRQKAEPGWAVPQDLLDRLALAETRLRIVNASDLKQYETVIREASTTPALLTCGDVDVLWRVAEAFARTERTTRAEDAYRYVLSNCSDAAERLATLQKALGTLPRAEVEDLLALEKDGEFAPIRDDLARQAVSEGGEDPKLRVAPKDLETVERLAEEKGLASDALLLGWYHIRRDQAEDAETWFRRADEAEDTAQSSQGLALALLALDRPVDAEAELEPWRADSDDTRATYMAAVANMLAITPPLDLPEEKLGALAAAVGEDKDAAAAQQFGWYADALNQFPTAAEWFRTALRWKPDDEPSAYGLALMHWKTGDQAGVAEVQRLWAQRSPRIATVGQPESDAQRERGRTAPSPIASVSDASPLQNNGAVLTPYGANQVQPASPEAELRLDQLEVSSFEPIAPEPQQELTALRETSSRPPREQAARPARRAASAPRGCVSSIDPRRLSAEAALARGWCLMERRRPMEAAAAFDQAVALGSAREREDAAYGQSLAYLEAGLTDKAAVAAIRAPQNAQRSTELQVSLLASRANSLFEARRYAETIAALDQRARIAPELTGLMVLRGYAYLALDRYDSAEEVFRAAAQSGNVDARKGLILTETRRREAYRDTPRR